VWGVPGALPPAVKKFLQRAHDAADELKRSPPVLAKLGGHDVCPDDVRNAGLFEELAKVLGELTRNFDEAACVDALLKVFRNQGCAFRAS
jgi:hypothetical protein